MNPLSWAGVACLLALAGCASTPLVPEAAPDVSTGIEATPLPAPAAAVRVVERPVPLPLPGQLKPVPSAQATVRGNPAREVVAANTAARMEPEKAGFLNAIQVWPYSAGALYQVYASPGRVTDIALQPGEGLVSVSAGDTVRWIVGDTVSGEGATERVHVLVKPSRSGLRTNLVINTDRRSYYLELSSTPDTWMASVAWEYPGDLVRTLAARSHTAPAAAVGSVAPERLRFRYAITGDTPPWRPLRAFDDGSKVYIQFPPDIGQGELPPLFVTGARGDTQLVNYRVRLPYLVVDRLFGAAELRLGGKRQQVVRIVRTDARAQR